MTDILTKAELAIASGTAGTELCREMIQTLRDAVAAHAAIPEISGNYFAAISAAELLAKAERILALTTRLAGIAVLSEREVCDAEAPTH
jgi:hypothetical protein